MPTNPGRFIWYELMTMDVEAAARFYGSVVGWSVQDSGQAGMDYRLWSIGGESVGGLMAIPADAAAHGMRPAWLGYVTVADVDASVAEIAAAGGAVHTETMDVPGVGRFATVSDPQGASFYVMTPTGDGASPAYAPGKIGHGGWHELHTTDWRAALDFYGARLGWAKSEEMDMGPMGTYLLFNAGEGPIGGMMNNPNVPRPMWMYYFNVEDITAAISRLNAAGGSVLTGPHEVPGGLWMIQGQDSLGAMFGLLAPVKS